jgi:hypothetical protein
MNLFYYILEFFAGFALGTFLYTGRSIGGFSLKQTQFLLGEFIKDVGHHFDFRTDL